MLFDRTGLRFEVEVGSEGECGQGSQLKLTALPISKGTMFDMKG